MVLEPRQESLRVCLVSGSDIVLFLFVRGEIKEAVRVALELEDRLPCARSVSVVCSRFHKTSAFAEGDHSVACDKQYEVALHVNCFHAVFRQV